jgi:transcriptional regulator with XRE-family HTH domain
MPKHPAELESDIFCELLAGTMLDMRTETGLSKSQVAANSKVSPQMVGYVETKFRRPGIDIFVRIVRGKGLLPSEVMAETEKRAGWTRGPGGELKFTSVK